jgi:hypothetical protein
VSRFNRESLRLDLGRDSITLQVLDRRSKAWSVRAQLPVHPVEAAHSRPEDLPPKEVHDTVDELLRKNAPAGALLSTLLGDECVRYFVVEPPGNARSTSDLRLAAGLRMEMLYGDAPADWTIDADWSATRRFLACAVPTAILAAVSRSIVACNLVDAGTTPEFVSSWNRHSRRMRDQHAWIVHAGRQVVVLAACVDSSVAAVSVPAAVGLPLSSGAMMLEIERYVLRWNLPAPETVYLLGEGFASFPDQRVGASTLVRMPSAAEAMLVGKAA